jgi:hypothetical protein
VHQLREVAKESPQLRTGWGELESLAEASPKPHTSLGEWRGGDWAAGLLRAGAQLWRVVGDWQRPPPSYAPAWGSWRH